MYLEESWDLGHAFLFIWNSDINKWENVAALPVPSHHFPHSSNIYVETSFFWDDSRSCLGEYADGSIINVGIPKQDSALLTTVYVRNQQCSATSGESWGMRSVDLGSSF